MCGVLFGLCSLTNLTALSSVCCLKVCFPNHGEAYKIPHREGNRTWTPWRLQEGGKADFKSVKFHLLSYQVASSLRLMPVSWWRECGVMHLCLLWGPWCSGAITAQNLTALPAALTGRRQTTSCRLCLTSSAFSSSATCCPAPSSSSPTLASWWRCGDHARPSSNTCPHRRRPPTPTRSLSRWTCVFYTLQEAFYHFLYLFHVMYVNTLLID